MTDDEKAQEPIPAVACGLVLVTGLPASGKSTLVRGLESCLGSGSHPSVYRVLRADDFLRVAATEASTGGVPQPQFDPDQWRRSQEALHSAVDEALDTLLGTWPCLERPPWVVVEDNMHLRSMREYYWELCRRAEARWAAPTGAVSRIVVMLELRMTVPVGECLRRNLARQSADTGSPTLPPVPSRVIIGMAARFDTCLLPAAALDSARSPHCGPWKRLPCSHPWPVFGLETSALSASTQDNVSANATAQPKEIVEGARQMVTEQWPDGSLWAQEVHTVARYWSQPVSPPPSSEASSQSASHVFDLQLRAVVKQFFSEHGCLVTQEMQKHIQKAKQTCLQRWKHLWGTASGVETDEQRRAAEQQLLVDFQCELCALTGVRCRS